MLQILTKLIATLLGAVVLLLGNWLRQRGIETGDLTQEGGGIVLQVAAVLAGVVYKVWLHYLPSPKGDPTAVDPTLWKGRQLIILLCLMPLIAAMAGAGCESLKNVSAAYVNADRLTYEAVGPEYREYVSNDVGLTQEQKDRRYRTIDTWKLRWESGQRAQQATTKP